MHRDGTLLFLWAMGYHIACLPAFRMPGGAFLAPMAYLTAMVLWCFRTGRAASLGLMCPRKLTAGQWLRLWPLGVLPAWNLLYAGLPAWDVGTMLPLALGSLVEELFFRGALLALLEKKRPGSGVFLSALLFSAYHCISPDPSAGQLWCALAAGVCYGEVTVFTGSLLPALLAHVAVNLTSPGQIAPSPPSLWLCAGVCLLWGISQTIQRKKDLLCNST